MAIKKVWTRLVLGAVLSVISGGLSPSAIWAQHLTLDGSLGSARPLIGPKYTIKQSDGRAVGNNLFHSFGKFNLNQGEEAAFESLANIRNLLVRVTGKGSSFLDGKISTQPGVNFFLLNPNGIVFGRNASLNVGGSFVATTAESYVFADGTRFSAVDLQPPSLLAINTPIGLQFGSNPGRIENQSQFFILPEGLPPEFAIPVGLQVRAQQTLALVGGDILLNQDSYLTASGGKIELGSVGGESFVGINATPSPIGWSFDYARVKDFRNIKLDYAIADTSGSSFPPIGSEEFFSSQSGDIHLRGNQIRLENSAGILTFNDENDPAGSNPGSILVEAKRLELIKGGDIRTDSFGSAPSGNVTVIADSILLSGKFGGFGAPAQISARNSSDGKAGDINIITQHLVLEKGATITASAADGQGGTMAIANFSNTVNAPSSILLTSGSSLRTRSTGESGVAGTIKITTGVVTVQGGSEISVQNQLGTLPAGNIEINARLVQLLDQGNINASSAGAGGSIRLKQLELLLLRQQSGISTNADTGKQGGQLPGGNIDIDARFIVAVPQENSDITAKSFAGNGGNITIRTQGIFGIQERNPLTALSDINASSELGINGTVKITTPDVNPSRSAVVLPVNLVDPTTQIAQGCIAQQQRGESGFVVTGRGGVPLSPSDPLVPETVLTNWISPSSTPTVETKTEQQISTAETPQESLTAEPPAQIVEAQGWIKNAKGEVFLVAQVPAVPARPATPSC
jgi:filamentous hemagglutinin family protein